MSADGQLLRRFEPIIRYTKGERFLPVDVEDYVRQCALWAQLPDSKPVCVVPEGELTLERLAETRRDNSGARHYLKFIDPLNVAQLAAYRVQQSRARRHGKKEEVFRAGRGRLARVGYVPRFLDVLFSLTLLVRGRVSGDTAAAASIAYERMIGEKNRHCYYGRVIRENSWVVLQYWFFYPFNNWRSGFFGLNDHEADWEMACVYLYEDNGELRPEWVAFASHDFSGDDLRRRWDDPELQKVGEHPVIYAGAGSHAGYYAPGEYLTEIELPFLSPVARVAEEAQSLWHRAFRQYRGTNGDGDGHPHIFRIPFVDYARGDGLSIGPGGHREWSGAYVIDPAPSWVSGYRGLWGLYAQDPIAGEDAPAGPMYNRDGTVRRSWYDPVGWAGLDKVPPPDKALAHVIERRLRIEERCKTLEGEIEEKSHELSGLGTQAAAMSRQTHLKKEYEAHEKRIAETSRELVGLRAELESDRALVESLHLTEGRVRAGDKDPPRAHIRRAHRPASDENLRLDRLAEAWAAISIALTMVVFVALMLFAEEEYLIFGLSALVALLIFVEAGFRRRLARLTTSVTVGLAIVASLILLYEFFWETLVVAVLAAAGYMVWENLRELWT